MLLKEGRITRFCVLFVKTTPSTKRSFSVGKNLKKGKGDHPSRQPTKQKPQQVHFTYILSDAVDEKIGKVARAIIKISKSVHQSAIEVDQK